MLRMSIGSQQTCQGPPPIARLAMNNMRENPELRERLTSNGGVLDNIFGVSALMQ